MVDSNGGRVTMREVYKLVLAQNETRAKQHLEVIEKIHAVELVLPQIETNAGEIEKLRKRSNLLDGANTILLLIGAYIAATFKNGS